MTAIPPAIVEAIEEYRVAVDDQATNYASFSIQRHHHKAVDDAHAALVAAIADALDGLREERDEALLEIQRLSVEYQDTLDEERKRMWR